MRRLMPETARATPNKGQPRRRVKPLWRQPSLVSIVVLAAAAMSGGGSWWLWQTGWIQDLTTRTKEGFVLGTAKVGLAVSEIFVEGRMETEKAALLASLHLARGAPILSLDLKQARARVIALPWVRTAEIERQLPDVIHLRLQERRPLALWQNQGRFSLIDTRGNPIPLSDIGRFSNLVVVVGRDAPLNAVALLDTLAVAPELARKVKAAVRVGGRRWDVQLENRVEVKLPEADAIAAWVQLAEMQDRHQLLDTDVSVIDLRLPDRIIVRQATGRGPGSDQGSKKIFTPSTKPGSQPSKPGVERNT